MISARLPDFLRDLDRILRREMDDALLDELAPARTRGLEVIAEPPPLSTRSSGTLVVESSAIREESVRQDDWEAQPDDLPGPVVVVPRVDLGVGVAALLREFFGTDSATIDDLARLGDLARTAYRAETARIQIRSRIDELRARIEEAEFERDLAREEAGLEIQERTAAEEERADAERRLRYLQVKLAGMGQSEVAWSQPDIDIRDIRPESFVELLERMNDLAYVVFTGDMGVTEGLDKHGPSISWAGKSWDALLALEDYARISNDRSFGRDVSGYLMEPPPGCRGFPANRHAARESDTIEQNPSLRRPRELPVPLEISTSGRAFMAAHFKIAQSAMVSPRIHYLDGTSITGKVYVGHIGPHLPTSDS